MRSTAPQYRHYGEDQVWLGAELTQAHAIRSPASQQCDTGALCKFLIPVEPQFGNSGAGQVRLSAGLD